MQTQMQLLSDFVRTSHLSGDPLHRRTGRLSRSVTGKATGSGAKIIGICGTSGVPYAYVHEMGGTFDIPAHSRRVGYNAKEERIRLLTKIGRVRAAVKSQVTGTVRAHSATYPQRAFLKPSFEERKDDIVQALRRSIVEAMNAT